MVGGLVVLILLVSLMAIEPYGDYRVARDRVDDLSADQSELVAAVEQLEQERERLDDPAALEEEARSELGLSRPGEIPYIVVNPPTTAPVVPPEPEAEPVPSVMQRALDWFSSLTRPVE